MSQVFVGSVLMSGDQGPGLEASFAVDDEQLRLATSSEELGAWDQSDYSVTPTGKGSFRVVLGGEAVMFTPSSPSAFAEAMSVPIKPEVAIDADDDGDTEDSAPKYDYDAAIDDVIANAKPMLASNDADDLLSKPMLVTIVTVAGALGVGLVGMTLML